MDAEIEYLRDYLLETQAQLQDMQLENSALRSQLQNKCNMIKSLEASLFCQELQPTKQHTDTANKVTTAREFDAGLIRLRKCGITYDGGALMLQTPRLVAPFAAGTHNNRPATLCLSIGHHSGTFVEQLAAVDALIQRHYPDMTHCPTLR
eukprot:jgi/Chrzof1/12583/UNPLg00536.t1